MINAYHKPIKRQNNLPLPNLFPVLSLQQPWQYDIMFWTFKKENVNVYINSFRLLSVSFVNLFVHLALVFFSCFPLLYENKSKEKDSHTCPHSSPNLLLIHNFLWAYIFLIWQPFLFLRSEHKHIYFLSIVV